MHNVGPRRFGDIFALDYGATESDIEPWTSIGGGWD